LTIPIITLTTDYGINDHLVGVLKGVILKINPEAQIVDITHQVAPFDLLDGALSIAAAYSYFPPRSIHVVIIDPGVGTERRPILVSGQNQYFIAPDNGVLSGVYEKEHPVIVRHITSEHYFLQPVSNTFHARDIFSPVAAYLAKQVDTLKFGDEVEDYVRFAAPKPKAVEENRFRAVVLKVDRFGNLMTNITAQDVPALFQSEPGPFKILVGNREVTEMRSAYAEGAPGEVFAIVGSMGFLEIAANRGAAAQLAGAGKGSEVNVVLGGAAAAKKGA